MSGKISKSNKRLIVVEFALKIAAHHWNKGNKFRRRVKLSKENILDKGKNISEHRTSKNMRKLIYLGPPNLIRRRRRRRRRI